MINRTEEGDPFVDELFDDVRLMIERARKHQTEFDSHFGGNESAPWWSIDEAKKSNGIYAYTLVVRCQQLKELKPIAADLCNNLIHALDQMIGALTRANGRDNSDRLQFPWRIDDAEFARAISKLEGSIGSEAMECIRSARNECAPSLEIAHLAKEVSNFGKHWELVPSAASFPAIAVQRPGAPQQIFTLPVDSIETELFHTFYEGPERLGQFPMYIVLGLKFAGLSNGNISPGSVFGSAFHYVETVFRKVSGSKAVAASALAMFSGPQPTASCAAS